MRTLRITLTGDYLVAKVGINSHSHDPVDGCVQIPVAAGTPIALVVHLSGSPGFHYTVDATTEVGCRVEGEQAQYPTAELQVAGSEDTFLDTLTVHCE